MTKKRDVSFEEIKRFIEIINLIDNLDKKMQNIVEEMTGLALDPDITPHEKESAIQAILEAINK